MRLRKQNIIISLGGSLLSRPEINIDYLKDFRRIILAHIPQKRFFLYTGGGKIARIYQNGLRAFGASNYYLDWIGIWATRMNARIVKQVFKEHAESKIIFNPTKKIKIKKPVIIAAGWKPGWSTDCDAVLLAKTYGIKTVVNLTNIDYVYDKDPKKSPDAKAFKKMNWKQYRNLINDKWEPGLSTPFDPIASKLAQKLNIKVVILNGKYLDRLQKFLDSKKIIGTEIS
jgi:uridylate kinase